MQIKAKHAAVLDTLPDVSVSMTVNHHLQQPSNNLTIASAWHNTLQEPRGVGLTILTVAALSSFIGLYQGFMFVGVRGSRGFR